MKKAVLWILVVVCLPTAIFFFSRMGQYEGVERLAFFLIGLAVVLPGALAAAAMGAETLGEFASSFLMSAGGKLTETPEILSPIQGLMTAGAYEEAALRLEEELEHHPRSENLALLKMENLLAMAKHEDALAWAATFLLHPLWKEKCGESSMRMALLYCDQVENRSVQAEQLLQKLLPRVANEEIRKMLELRLDMVQTRLRRTGDPAAEKQ